LEADVKNVYDIVIVGGGVCGTALACSIGKVSRKKKACYSLLLIYLSSFFSIASNPLLQHQRVALVEAMDLTTTMNWSPQPDHFSNRTVSLTPGSMRLLQRK
jgi:ubiquinone biosynthesis monooxygenase Coq6